MLEDNITYKEILDNIDEGVYFVDRDRRILYWNKGAERITGFTADQLEGHFCTEEILNHVDGDGTQLCVFGCPLHAAIIDGKSRQAEIFVHHKQGHLVPIVVRISALRDEKGEVIGAVETFSDNTKVMTIQHQVRRLEDAAFMDPVTGIGNRRALERRLQVALLEYEQQDVPFGLLFMDIDGFKKINDTYGHNAGDQVLAVVANTMKNYLRSDDTVARWGGEEFVALIRDVDEAGLKSAAEKISLLVANSAVRVKNEVIRVTISIGMSSIQPGDSISSIIERADAAMYHQKRLSRDSTNSAMEDAIR